VRSFSNNKQYLTQIDIHIFCFLLFFFFRHSPKKHNKASKTRRNLDKFKLIQINSSCIPELSFIATYQVHLGHPNFLLQEPCWSGLIAFEEIQGCSSASLAANLSLGSVTIVFLIKSLADPDIFSIPSVHNLNFPMATLSRTLVSVTPSKGRLPDNSRYNITPHDQISHF